MEKYPESDNPPSYDEATGSSSSHMNKGFQLNAIPTSSPALPSNNSFESVHSNFCNLTEEDLREACLDYVSTHCCYGTKFIRNWFLVSIENGYTFHYKLESFGEKRESVDHREEGYHGLIDGRENGPAPDPWEIPMIPPIQFKDYKTKREIPHTAYFSQCVYCSGVGTTDCVYCLAKRCWGCKGTGRNDNNEMCYACMGSKTECYHCNGTTRYKCSNCGGCGKVKHCRMLSVTWKNHSSDFISASLNLPKDLIKEVSGRTVFEEESVKLRPVTVCPDPKVNAASQVLITKHANSFRDELIRNQRHVIRAIPITRAFYKWKSSEGMFYVYGLEKKVYFENYPQKLFFCNCL